MPVVRELADFPRGSGHWLERAVFNHRLAVTLACLVATLVLGFFAARVSLNASFEKMIPVGHPYIQNYLQNRSELRGMGNTLRVVVENEQGDIFDARYLDVLRRLEPYHHFKFATPP
jgi:predicted RND superfamily exporter protein